ncbi:MAG: tripartite tricarboxylate transporter substrate binding protein [Hyphomicrobiaceae bacterium]
MRKVLLIVATATAAVAPMTLARAAWPDRPINFIVPWGAGGGTDQVARIFAAGLEKQLGQPVNVVNKTGGNGIVGHAAISTAAPDGYTVGACTSEITYFKTVGLGAITPDSFTLVSRLATIPAGVTVSAKSPYKDLKALMADIKAKPKGTFTTSGSGAGGPWHMAIAGLTKAAGMPADQVKFVPSQGGAPALQDLVAGGLTMVTASPIEAKALSEAGSVRILATMDEKRLSSFPNVPTVKEATGLDWSLVNWFSFCAPKGLSPDILAKLADAGGKAHASAMVQDPLKKRGITPVWDGPVAFKAFAAKFATTAAALLKDLGLAK